MNYKNKTVIVTGGGQGIGRAVSQAFAEAGADVVIAELDREAGRGNEEYIRKQGGSVLFVETDVADEASVRNMAERAAAEFGRIDVLINNAGIGSTGAMLDNPVEVWDRVIAVNLRGTYMCSKYCAAVMSSGEGGCIINIASTRAFMSEPDTEPYSASKGGIIALTHSMALSLSKHKIRVNSISPGWIDVTGWQKAGQAAQAELSEADHLQHPAGRVGRPGDIAKACLYLCSEDAGFITGTNLTIDGGMTVKMIYV
jgi:NAD(P)-dependent dehydrogenase (short-subunit alcohol dehydrogenase family)